MKEMLLFGELKIFFQKYFIKFKFKFIYTDNDLLSSYKNVLIVLK